MRERRGRRITLVAALVVLMATVGASNWLSVLRAPASAVDPGPGSSTHTARIMVVGDSISQASAGDYSWRYFAWKHWESVGAQTDLVGPKRDPQVDPGTGWSAAYADANFDQDHAATWGDSLISPLHDRDSLMDDYAPDIVVVELGVNDLLFKYPPAAVADLMRRWVLAARARTPDADFVLAEAPWTASRAKAYNSALVTVAGQLTTEGSRVVVAQSTRGYVMGRANGRGDTYDLFHPNTRGQVKIAAAVTDAVATLGVGSNYPRPLVIPPEGPRVFPVLKDRSTETSARWRWSTPPGATSYDVWLRRPGKPWTRAARAHPRNSFRTPGLRPCLPHQLRVRARKGWTLAGEDMTSSVVTARVGPKVVGRMRLRSLSPLSRGVRVTWARKAGACSYVVRATYEQSGQPEVTRRIKVNSSHAVVRQIPRGQSVRIRVRAVGARNSTGWSKALVGKVRR